MAGNKAGSEKMIVKMVERFGSYEAWRDFMRENGRKGGTISKGGGFSGPEGRERASIAGQIGGRISRKPKQHSPYKSA